MNAVTATKCEDTSRKDVVGVSHDKDSKCRKQQNGQCTVAQIRETDVRWSERDRPDHRHPVTCQIQHFDDECCGKDDKKRHGDARETGSQHDQQRANRECNGNSRP